MSRSFRSIIAGVMIALIPGWQLVACTSIGVTKGASVDGSIMVTYSADSHTLYGELYHTPGGVFPAGSKRKIHEWDTGKFLGEIDQAPRTYNVVGNMNEFQVVISESTWANGREKLHAPNGILDYGSLIYVTLERARSAREAIEVLTNLVAQYGYCSTGESMLIADAHELWLLEIIGKGGLGKGAVWVALKVPDGYICAHANGARIQKFALNDPENVLYAADVISFARASGYFEGEDREFSFSDAYDPADFHSARFCDARVWCAYNRTLSSNPLPADRVLGKKGAPRLPLWVKPERQLSTAGVMQLMRDHYEGTPLDMTQDVGAGPFGLGIRARPLTYKVNGKEYFHERAISTQQTGFSFVSQSRGKLPNPIGGLLWFGVDDTFSTVYFPVYCSATRVPKSYAVGTGSFRRFSWDSAFWVFNHVSNYAYGGRYSDIIKDVQVVQRELEGRFLAEQSQVEQEAEALYKVAPQRTIDYLTAYSESAGEEVVHRWKELGVDLMTKYLDGNVRDALGAVTHPGYPPEWYATIATATGERLQSVHLETNEHAKNQKPVAKSDQGALVAGIFKLLESRSVVLTDTQRESIEHCDDIEKLQLLLVRSATASSSDDVLMK